MRVATIDIGTNTTLLLVAERSGDDELVAVEEHATITRLGEGVDRTRALAPAAIARTNACLDRYSEIVARAGVERVAVVGTSAMRDAGGGDEVRDHVKARFGVDARTISGDEEARLTFRGALSGIPVERTGRRVVVFDIGGGSTEVVHGDRETGRIDYAKSFDVGSVQLTERCIRVDPPTEEELGQVQSSARAVFEAVPALAFEGAPVGIAGTVTTLAAVAMEMALYDGARVHGSTMSLAELGRVSDRLARATLAERCRMPGLEPKRADVIVAGALIARALMDRLGSAALTISDRGVRWGLAEELLG